MSYAHNSNILHHDALDPDDRINAIRLVYGTYFDKVRGCSAESEGSSLTSRKCKYISLDLEHGLPHFLPALTT